MRARRIVLVGIAGTLAALAVAGPAAACGGLVGENGSIALVRTTTLAAWHDGVEHYVTSFEFSGSGEAVGSIVPLPGVPTSVEPGGEWTLQRLRLEVEPPCAGCARAAGASAEDGGGVEVLLETQVDALDITVLRGGGDAVGEWALDNGFFLSPDAPEVLDFYAERSPVFLAARFDAGRAAAQGLVGGQGTPVHVTVPTPRPWVPLRILGLGLPAGERVQADVFLLTDDEPKLLAGGDGLDVARSEPASTPLLDDLRSDRGMAWVPTEAWLTHLQLDEQAGDLDYDLSASGGDGRPGPTLRDAGLVLASANRAAEAVDPRGAAAGGARAVAWVGLAAGLVLLAAGGGLRLRTTRC